MAFDSSSDAGLVSAPRPLSLFQRAIAVYTRPADAWGGLKERPQWWFPLLIMLLVSVASTALLYNRALLPTMVERWETQVSSGQIQPDQLDKMEQFMRSPAGLLIGVIQQVIFFPLVTFASALLVWLGVGLVLGSGMRYRLALEVLAWSMLVTIPATLVVTAFGWVKQTMTGVHAGFGILLPEMDPPSKLYAALGAFLDWIGPFSIWFLLVAVLGAAALSGAPRKSVALTLGILYLIVGVFMALLAALVTPAA
jgi:hypothetical protein